MRKDENGDLGNTQYSDDGSPQGLIKRAKDNLPTIVVGVLLVVIIFAAIKTGMGG